MEATPVQDQITRLRGSYQPAARGAFQRSWDFSGRGRGGQASLAGEHSLTSSASVVNVQSVFVVPDGFRWSCTQSLRGLHSGYVSIYCEHFCANICFHI